MALDTFAGLKAAISDFLNRPDMTTAQVEMLVSLAETDIRNDVRTRSMEASTAVTLTGQTLPHPTLMLEARNLDVDDYNYEFVPLDVFTSVQKAQAVSRVFTSNGSNFLINQGGTDAVANLTYVEAPQALAASTATNYILTYAPDVYLYGACAHGAQYYQDDGNLVKFKQLYQGAVNRLNTREQNSRFSGSNLSIYPVVSE